MLDALDEQLDPVLRLPVGGVDVLVHYPTIRVGLRCKRFYANLLAGRPAESLNPAALLLPDPPAIAALDLERCAWTALAYFGAGPDAAMRVWTGDTAPSEPDVSTELIDGPYGPYDPAPGAYGEDDPGGGPYNPDTSIRDWYDDAPAPRDLTVALSWSRLLERWTSVACDFQQHYDVDLDDVLDRRHIGWFETRLAGLQDIAGSRIQLLTLTKED